MFKDKFVLKKSAWHCRLMKYIWSWDHQDFTHMCPYFWLSIFNILICPLFVLWKAICYLFTVIGYFFTAIIEKIDAYYEEQYERDYALYKEKLKSDTSLMDKLAEKLFKERKLTKAERQFNNDLVYGYDEQELYNTFMQRREMFREKYYEKEYQQVLAKETKKVKEIVKKTVKTEDENLKYKRYLTAEEARRKRKAAITKVVLIIKPIFTFLAYSAGILILLAAGYALLKLIMLLNEVPKATYTSIGQFTGKGIIIICGLFLIITFLVMLIKYLKIVQISIKVSQRTINIFSITGKVISFIPRKIWQSLCWCGNGIVNIISFIIQMFKDNCPAVEWKE